MSRIYVAAGTNQKGTQALPFYGSTHTQNRKPAAEGGVGHHRLSWVRTHSQGHPIILDVVGGSHTHAASLWKHGRRDPHQLPPGDMGERWGWGRPSDTLPLSLPSFLSRNHGKPLGSAVPASGLGLGAEQQHRRQNWGNPKTSRVWLTVIYGCSPLSCGNSLLVVDDVNVGGSWARVRGNSVLSL